MRNVNPTHFENIPTIPDDAEDDYTIHGIIETPSGQRNKYAFDPTYGIFKLNTTIAKGLSWPYDYGFIPQTLGDDGDPLDLLYLSDEQTFCGCLVAARLLGSVRLEKNGEENDRFIGCALRIRGRSQSTDAYEDIDDLPDELMDNICNFLTEYSAEQGNTMDFKGVQSRKKARASVAAGIKAFKKTRRKAKN